MNFNFPRLHRYSSFQHSGSSLDGFKATIARLTASRNKTSYSKTWDACIFTLIFLLTGISGLQAQTNVTGAIAVNTHWTADHSPYLLSGDTVVQNNAVLTIDPGVTIYMGAGANLNVQSGSLQAPGTSANPINVLSDKSRLAQAAQPGDWKHWGFYAGTVNTRLEHVNFEHGSGLLVNGAAPVFNHVTINHQLGAAITVDLSASPTGVGNQAAGNTINAISVPAGDIKGQVKWGLRGIPYHINSGVVSVGTSPTVTSHTPGVIQQGLTVAVGIQGTRLTGLSQVKFSGNGLSAQIAPNGTDTQASLNVSASQTADLGKTAARFLVDAGEIVLANALTVVPTQPILTTLEPNKLYLGQGNVELIINGNNFIPQSTILINGNSTTTQYQSATKVSTTVATPATVGTLPIKVQTPDPFHDGQFLLSNELSLPVVQGQLTVTPATATATQSFTKSFTVTSPYPAGSDGIIVNLVSSVPTVGSVSSTVTIPAGQSSASFNFTPTQTGNTVITASKLGFISGQSQVSVVPPPTLTLTPSQLTLGVGRTATVTVSSSTPAGQSGIQVTLTSGNTGIATVPQSVTIPSGASTASFTVNTVAIGETSITASADEFAQGTTVVKVRPVSLNLPTGVVVAPGLTRSVPLILSDPAPTGGLTVNLASSNTANATVPASITVPEGQTSANFTLTGVAAGAVTVTASAEAYQAASMTATVQVITIGIGSPSQPSISLQPETSKSYPVTLSNPAPAGGVTVNLAVANTAIATVTPVSITIPQGQTSGGVIQATINGLIKGTTTLTASSEGLNSANVALTITDKPALKLQNGGNSGSSVTVGKGLKTYVYEAMIYRVINGSSFNGADPVTVSLTSSDPSKLTVPATVTIPANSSYSYFTVTGVDLTNGTPVTIDASATGYTPPATKLTGNVVAPVLSLASLDGTRSPASIRDNFNVSLSVPGSVYSGSQTAVANLPIDISIVNANPVGIVDGFYSAATAGTAVTQVTVAAGSSSSNQAYVGTPSVAGSYQVQAGGTDMVAVTSGVQTVSAPALKILNGGNSGSSVTVGKGLKTYVYEAMIYRVINGSSFNGADPVTVSLTSSDPSKLTVPATVTIPANSSYSYFTVTGVDLTNGTPVTIDASATGYTPPATKLTGNVVAPVLSLSSLDGARSPASNRDNFYVSLSVPGSVYSGSQTAAANLPIDISIVNANPSGIVDGFYSAATAGTAVTQVTVAAGSSSSNQAYVGTPSVAGSYQVQAGGTDMVAVTSGVQTVSAPALKILNGGNSGSSVTVGKGLKTYVYEAMIYRVINGSSFNGADPVTVSLTSSDPSKLTVPATVTIPANSSYSYFTVTGVDLTNGTPVTIDASATGYTPPATKLTGNVVAPVLSLSSLDGARSPASNRDNFYVSLSVPGSVYSGSQTAAANLPIDISIVNANPSGIVDGFYSAATAGTAVTQVTVAADNSSSNQVYVATPSVAGTYQVQAGGTNMVAVTSAVQTVTAPALKLQNGGNSGSSVTVGKGLKTYVYEAMIYRVINGSSFNGADPVTVNLNCSSTAICKVPATVTIPANNSYTYFPVEGVDLGNTTITASATGYNSPTQDLSVGVVSPQLNFSGPANTKVGNNSSFYVYLTAPGSVYSSSQTATNAISINITSSSPSVATTPTSVTIPINSTSSNTGLLTGIAAGTTTLTASGASLSSATSNVITVSP